MSDEVKKHLYVRDLEVVYRKRACELESKKISGSQDVYRLLGVHSNRAHESLWAVLLDARHNLIGIHECARGDLSSVPVSVGTLFRAALVTGAVGVVIVHNHPSGVPEPSAEDLAFTTKVVMAASILGVPVLDHVIIAEGGFYSMIDAGTMPKGKMVW